MLDRLCAVAKAEVTVTESLSWADEDWRASRLDGRAWARAASTAWVVEAVADGWR